MYEPPGLHVAVHAAATDVTLSFTARSLRSPKVRNLDGAVRSEKQVRALEVSVSDTLRVQVCDSAYELPDVGADRGLSEWTKVPQQSA